MTSVIVLVTSRVYCSLTLTRVLDVALFGDSGTGVAPQLHERLEPALLSTSADALHAAEETDRRRTRHVIGDGRVGAGVVGVAAEEDEVHAHALVVCAQELLALRLAHLHEHGRLLV